MSFRIRLEKESVKFSCSHFTIFGADSSEPLHGHNYYVTADFTLSELDPDLGMAFDFNLLKPVLKQVAEALDERVLIPLKSKFMTVETSGDQLFAVHGRKRYAFPLSDVLQLNVVNITSEELAREFSVRLQRELRKHDAFKRITALSVGIQETRGQTVFYETSFK